MREKTKKICYVALAAAVLCVLSPWAIYATAVPITLSFLAVLLISWLFEPRVAFCATLIYVALGAVGVPVFAGFAGGFQVIAGPTGGFILSYPITALICSTFGTTTVKKLIFGAVSAILSYIMGIGWMSFTTSGGTEGFGASFCTLSYLIVIFILVDLAKIIVAMIFSSEIKKRIKSI